MVFVGSGGCFEVENGPFAFDLCNQVNDSNKGAVQRIKNHGEWLFNPFNLTNLGSFTFSKEVL
jgi:hypothetical protein